MNDILRKLTSRKLWMALAGVATGVAVILGADGADIQTVAGAVTSLASAICYIITEGKVDAARVQNVLDGIEVLTDECDLQSPEN